MWVNKEMRSAAEVVRDLESMVDRGVEHIGSSCEKIASSARGLLRNVREAVVAIESIEEAKREALGAEERKPPHREGC